MPRVSRGFGDCHVQHTLGTGAQCLGQSVPLHHPLRLNRLLAGDGDAACSGGSCHTARCSQPDLVPLRSHRPARGRGRAASFLQTSYQGLVFCWSYAPSPTAPGQAAAWRKGGGLPAAAAPDVWGCTGDITL